MKKYSGELALFSVTLLAALGWFVSKYAIAEMPPAGFLAVRFGIAALLFLPFSHQQLRQLDSGSLWRATAVGLAFSANIFLWIQAITRSTHFGEGAFLMSLSVLLAPLLSWLLFGHRPLRVFYISLIVAICGLAFLNTGRTWAQFSLSSFLYATSALTGALFFVLNNQYAKNLPTLALATVQLASAGVICCIYSLFFETWSPHISHTAWIWTAISILLITNCRYFLQTWGQKRCTVGNAALIMILEPVWTLILSIILLGENLTWQKAIGGSLILLALMLYRLPLQRLNKRFRQPEKHKMPK
ncbi:MAG: DMT family transporter [Alysiella sp.]|uniref:DMT family transporter n=1 Tax=Alysiella sp. TaxID=1872483 RepID=UPI0026DB755E|nr:DMT family transporter [Alysiella sp.]MDO4433650.1 DMT family transporter [Alysiella sp.]